MGIFLVSREKNKSQEYEGHWHGTVLQIRDSHTQGSHRANCQGGGKPISTLSQFSGMATLLGLEVPLLFTLIHFERQPEKKKASWREFEQSMRRARRQHPVLPLSPRDWVWGASPAGACQFFGFKPRGFKSRLFKYQV